MKNKITWLIAPIALAACVSQAGLKAQAADDMSCEAEKLSTKKVRSGYAGDDFGTRYEVEGCGEKVVYEKKGDTSWTAVSESESVE
jgi:hypothetical protein